MYVPSTPPTLYYIQALRDSRRTGTMHNAGSAGTITRIRTDRPRRSYIEKQEAGPWLSATGQETRPAPERRTVDPGSQPRASVSSGPTSVPTDHPRPCLDRVPFSLGIGGE